MATPFSDQNAVISCLNHLYSFDSDDLFINDLIQDNAETPPMFACGNCDEGTTATSRCKECNEYLCDKCVEAHHRVKLTKEHNIQRITGTPIQLSPLSKSSSSPTGSTVIYCEQHPSEICRFYCESCCWTICNECTMGHHSGHHVAYLDVAVENARAANLKLYSNSTTGMKSVKESLEMTQKMIENVNRRANDIRKDIALVMSKLLTAVKEREAELIKTIESIRTTKAKILVDQADYLKTTLNLLSTTTDKLSEALDLGGPMDLLNVKIQASRELKSITKSALKVSLSPLEDDNISFVLPDSGLLALIANFGEINCSTYINNSPPLPSFGEGGLYTSRNRTPSVSASLAPKSPLNDLSYTDNLDTYMKSLSLFGSSDNCTVYPDVEERHDSRFYSHPQFNPDCSINPELGMLNDRLPISYLFPSTCVRNSKKNNNLGGALLTFGREGDGDGELCRPWGVCCDQEGNIIVADRSNNRIQIFKSDGTFLHKFGKHGSEPGQFDRPAGVATNPDNDIVVADKDNHRIQIFTRGGKFKFTFGDKGSKTGQFNYPWDVDCNSVGHIVVSDTRNHRIQIFDADGSFLTKYGFDTTNMWKHFDSPRGVCFATNTVIVITDFNNHRLVVVEATTRRARFLGAEGSGMKQFLRPQGVVVDRDGHIVVADSRNNRIQVFEHNGNFLWQFGSSGKEPGQLDRPSGVCLTPDGKIVVVDFGNNRIQLF